MSTALNDDEGMRLFVLATAQSMKIHWEKPQLDLAIERQRILSLTYPVVAAVVVVVVDFPVGDSED